MLPIYLNKFLNISKKVFLVITVYIIVLGLFLTFAEKGPNKKTADLNKINQQQLYSVINNPAYSTTKDKKIGLTVLKSILCGGIGQACTDNPQDDQKNFSQSLLGMITAGITLPYINPPASGAYWAYSGLQNAGFIPKTYAVAGIGFSSISLFMPIWKAFRDVSYIIMVIVLIAIGFMIMFRMKLNPQTVVNIENSLPKVVIAMLLITFSFAVAGFMIDLMYILIILVIEIMSKAGNLNMVEQANSILTSSALWSDNLRQFWVYFNGLNSLWQIIPNALRFILTVITNTLTFLIILRFFSGHFNIVSGLFAGLDANVMPAGLGFTLKLGDLISALLIIVISTILSPIVILLLILTVVFIGLLTLMFRIFFMLLYSYVQIIIYIMFAPVFLISEALPGQKGFEPWIRNILGNLMVFPITIALLLTIRVIDQYASNGFVTDPFGVNPGIFLPPLLTGGSNSASLSVRPEYFIAIINAIFLMIIPDLAKSFKQMIIGKGGIQIPANVGALWGAAGAGLGSGVGLLGQISSVNLGLTALGLKGKDNEPGLPGVLKRIFGK